MKQSIIPAIRHSPLGSARLVPAARITGPTLGLLLCIVFGLVAGCTSNTKDGKSGAEKGGDTGGSGDKKSFTQGVLDLDPKILKERKITLPKGAKPLHPPGSVLDLVQSLDLLNRDSQTTCKCFTKAFEDTSPLIADKHAPAHEFVAIWQNSYGTLLPSETWNQIYGEPKSVETHDETGRAGACWDYWSIRCTDETVHVRGRFTKKTLLSFNQKEGKVSVERIFFTTHRDQICPKAKSMEFKGIFFSYK